MNKKTLYTTTEGWTLSVDPGSNKCGISLWYDGDYRGGTVLTSTAETDPISTRLQDICGQLESYLGYMGIESIERVICEGVRSRIVQICFGAILCNHRIQAPLSPNISFVETPQWKKWARTNGSIDKDPKGVDSLMETGWKYPVDSEDVADSIMIFLTWKDKYVQAL